MIIRESVSGTMAGWTSRLAKGRYELTKEVSLYLGIYQKETGYKTFPKGTVIKSCAGGHFIEGTSLYMISDDYNLEVVDNNSIMIGA